ncbi:GNAT family N-acetyltransferase [Streptomyces sp. AC1-42W]|uniref:GNAT family N-acetyltransferase n=2 Tax=unclassified Streptomyces TaxID=2593676 RepID=UPI000DADFCD9|nr:MULTISPECIES: GNAT family N-acetyltransferase [unclassified Streptomyces]PZT72452.1 GNAT family N-acetyltransferase [Streptomyces sp. AC1-42T]PZT81229.1 GNAT family N-acetyltransferase [Streptomyces sp. AC1-42W]
MAAMEQGAGSSVRIEPWAPGDLELLRRANAPELMAHLGGPEPEGKLLGRHARYLALSADRTGRGRMFRIALPGVAEAVGTIGFWEHHWRGREVYETGWTVLPEFQGRGIASAATRAVAGAARAEGRHRYLHAFPSVANGPSNGVCRKAGFTLLGEYEIEYPPGHPLLTNDWRLDLRAEATA